MNVPKRKTRWILFVPKAWESNSAIYINSALGTRSPRAGECKSVIRSENVNSPKHKTQWIFFLLKAWLFGVLSPKALIRIYNPRSKIVNASKRKTQWIFAVLTVWEPKYGYPVSSPHGHFAPTKVSSLHYRSYFAPYKRYFAPYRSYFASWYN